MKLPKFVKTQLKVGLLLLPILILMSRIDMEFSFSVSKVINLIICDIAIYADDTNLCSKCDQASDL